MKSQYKSAYAKKRAAKKPAARKPYVRKTAPKKKYATTMKKRTGIVQPSRVIARPGYISQSAWVSSNKPSKIARSLERVGMPNVYVTNNGGLQSTSTGCYSVASVSHQINVDISTLFSLLASTTPTNIGVRRLVLESYTGEIHYSNLSNAPMEVELYDVVLKKDLPRSNQLTAGSLNFTLPADPSAYITAGMGAGTGNSTIGGFNYPVNESLMFGSSVFDSQFFKDYFKVVKRTIVELPGGATHAHSVLLKTNKLIHQEEVVNATMDANRGLCCFTVSICRTFPEQTFQPGGTPILAFTTTTPGRLGIVNSRRYKWTWVQDIASSLNYANTVYRHGTNSATPSYEDHFIIPQTGVAAQPVDVNTGSPLQPDAPV